MENLPQETWVKVQKKWFGGNVIIILINVGNNVSNYGFEVGKRYAEKVKDDGQLQGVALARSVWALSDPSLQSTSYSPPLLAERLRVIRQVSQQFSASTNRHQAVLGFRYGR